MSTIKDLKLFYENLIKDLKFIWNPRSVERKNHKILYRRTVNLIVHLTNQEDTKIIKFSRRDYDDNLQYASNKTIFEFCLNHYLKNVTETGIIIENTWYPSTAIEKIEIEDTGKLDPIDN